MPTPIKFLGTSVTSLEMTLGYGNEQSYLRMNLVEDTRSGDSFATGIIGAPYSIQISGFRFDGILQQVEKANSTAGNPIYAAYLRSPNDFLDGFSLVLSNFTGAVNASNNLHNLYGFWEDRYGYGGALINDLGMVWEAPNYSVNVATGVITTGIYNGMYGIKPGIELLQTGAKPIFGNAFTFLGHTYTFDFSAIGSVDPNWRFISNGGSARLSEVIDTLCADKGYDYYVTLNMRTGTMGPHSIKINTIDRKVPPEIGKIEQYITGKPYAVARNFGRELSYEQTSLFLVGADVETMAVQNDPTKIYQFWGFDYNGIAITGASYNNLHTFNVPCPDIYDIVQTPYYQLSVGELRCALSNEDVWAGYVMHYKTGLAYQLGLASCFATDDEAHQDIDFRFAHDFITQGRRFAEEFARLNESDNWNRVHRSVYGFVRSYAENYYGRKYLVVTPEPFKFKFEPDSARIKWNWEPINDAYLPNGVMPLGLNSYYQNRFHTEEGRFRPLVGYEFSELFPLGISGADVNRFNGPLKITQSQNFYTTCNITTSNDIDSPVMFVGPTNTAVLVELDDALFRVAPDMVGGINDINDLFDIFSKEWSENRTSSTAGKLHPYAIPPKAFALPFRSNVLTYGPWVVNSGAARTEYRKEEALSPWTFGSYDYMNQAASGILADYPRASTTHEEGTVTFPDYPDKSLGDQILPFGPSITNMDINISDQGITTSYHFKTHTMRGGAFNKIRVERLARLGALQSKFGRDLLSIGEVTSSTIQNYTQSTESYRWLDRASRAVRQESPHGTLVGMQLPLEEELGVTKYINLVSSQTFEESIANATYSGNFINTACTSMDANYRPFSVDPAYSGAIPHRLLKSQDLPADALTAADWNHFGGKNDVDWYLFGDFYSGMHARKTFSNPKKARVLATRMPTYMVGWGYDFFGNPAPNSEGDCQAQFKADFINDYRRRSDEHLGGPGLFYWDQKRKGWGIPTHGNGVLIEACPGNYGGEAEMAVVINNEITEDRLQVWNYFTATIPAQRKVKYEYNQWEGRIEIVSADCTDWDQIPGAVTQNNDYDYTSPTGVWV